MRTDTNLVIMLVDGGVTVHAPSGGAMDDIDLFEEMVTRARSIVQANVIQKLKEKLNHLETIPDKGTNSGLRVQSALFPKNGTSSNGTHEGKPTTLTELMQSGVSQDVVKLLKDQGVPDEQIIERLTPTNESTGVVKKWDGRPSGEWDSNSVAEWNQRTLESNFGS